MSGAHGPGMVSPAGLPPADRLPSLSQPGWLPSAGLAPLRSFAQTTASESLQVEQIRVARDQLAEQRKTNQHLQAQPRRAAAVFEP